MTAFTSLLILIFLYIFTTIWHIFNQTVPEKFHFTLYLLFITVTWLIIYYKSWVASNEAEPLTKTIWSELSYARNDAFCTWDISLQSDQHSSTFFCYRISDFQAIRHFTMMNKKYFSFNTDFDLDVDIFLLISSLYDNPI